MTEISNEPNSVVLVIVQGSTFSFPTTITQVGTDFTTATVAGKIKNSFSALGAVATFTISGVTGAMDSLSFTTSLTAAETAALANLTSGERRQTLGVWDIEVTIGATVTRYLQGTAILSREATV